MKKFFVYGVLGAILLVIGIVVMVVMSINPIIEKAVNEYGPQLVGAEVRLNKADVSVFSGEGALKGLFIGNPKGFKSESAFTLGSVSVKVDKDSLTTDRIIIREIVLLSPKITYETAGKRSNIDALLANVKKAAGQDRKAKDSREKSGEAEPGGEQKIQIDNFIVRDGTVTLAVAALGGKGVQTDLPNIHIKDIGKDKDGATPAEAFEEIMRVLNKDIGGVATNALSGIASGVTKEAEGLLEGTGVDTKKLGGAIKGLFGD